MPTSHKKLAATCTRATRWQKNARPQYLNIIIPHPLVHHRWTTATTNKYSNKYCRSIQKLWCWILSDRTGPWMSFWLQLYWWWQSTVGQMTMNTNQIYILKVHCQTARASVSLMLQQAHPRAPALFSAAKVPHPGIHWKSWASLHFPAKALLQTQFYWIFLGKVKKYLWDNCDSTFKTLKRICHWQCSLCSLAQSDCGNITCTGGWRHIGQAWRWKMLNFRSSNLVLLSMSHIDMFLRHWHVLLTDRHS